MLILPQFVHSLIKEKIIIREMTNAKAQMTNEVQSSNDKENHSCNKPVGAASAA